MPEFRYSPLVDVPSGNPHFEGVLMRYGAVGQGPHGPEVFLPGSFGDLSQDSILLNVQHDRSRPLARTPQTMLLNDSTSMLTLVAKPPPTQEVMDARLMVQAGILQGLSIEFNAREQEHRNGVRIISKAELVGCALVDRGAYPDSIVEARRAESRARLGLTLRAMIPEQKKLSCECSGGKECHFADFQRGVIKQAFDRAFTRVC